MLVASGVLTCVLLGGSWLFARSQSGLTGATWFAIVCFFGQFLCILGSFQSPVFLLNALLVAVTAGVCRVRSTSTKSFIRSAVAVTLGSYAFCGLFAIESVRSYRELQDEFPMESLAARLQYEEEYHDPGSDDSPNVLDDGLIGQTSEDRLSDLEENFEASSPRYPFRRFMLKRLHASTIVAFTNSPSFGVSRMSYVTRRSLQPFDDPPISLPAPEPSSVRALSAEDENDSNAPGIDEGELHALRKAASQMHEYSVGDFANKGGWGYFVDRDHVSGFQSHRFRRQPKFDAHYDPDSEYWDSSWRLVRLELVSLMKHTEPRVYVSEFLPRMDELDEAASRELDDFESRALESLWAGEGMVDDVELNRVRMLGSLRAMRQCVECHAVERGALLGAFSYELRRTPPRIVPDADPTDGVPRT